MSRPLTTLFIVLALLAATLFARLGAWQVSRLHEKQAFNALVRGRLDSAIVDFAHAPHDAEHARFRRVRVSGAWDAAHEMVLTGRSRDGSPGVHLLTPLRIPGSDTALLVNRGWIYAPDAANPPDLHRWRVRADTATVSGFFVQLPSAVPRGAAAGTPPRVRWVDTSAIARWMERPVFGFQLVQEGDTASRDSTPARLDPPGLDEGPHRGYAFQWFAFAIIALVGVPVFVLTRGREAERARAVPPAPQLPR